MTFPSNSYRGTPWNKTGDKSVLRNSGNRVGLNLINVSIALINLHVDGVDGSRHTEKLIGFLKMLHHGANRPIFLMTDNARYHHSAQVKVFLGSKREQIIMAFLPLNSIEPYPKTLRANPVRTIQSKQNLESINLPVMHSIQQEAKRIRCFFCLADCLYAMHSALWRMWKQLLRRTVSC